MKNKKSKSIICGIVAATMTLGVAFSGCAFISKNNEADLKQIVASVDISGSDNLEKEGLKDYASAVTATEITKYDLMVAYVNVGQSYVNDSNMSYETVFTSLMTELTNDAVITQYATLNLLKYKATEESLSASAVVEQFNAQEGETAKYEYLLDDDGVKLARYKLFSSVNSALDTFEKNYLDDEDKTSGTESRVTPTGIDTAKNESGYYPDRDGELDYGIYTGFDDYLLDKAGVYEPLTGTNVDTRKKAYDAFLTRLKDNYMISAEDTELKDIMQISYIKEEYANQLHQVAINAYYSKFTAEQEAEIKKTVNGEYTFLKGQYESYLRADESAYSDSSAFESAIGSLSDRKFVYYSPDTGSTTEDGKGAYGFVYNILLPFDAKQSRQLKALTDSRDKKALDDSGYFAARNELLREIETTDQRSAWFNGTTDYSFKPEADLDYYGKNDGREYLFFENNIVNTDKYEALDKYLGKYSYNGTVGKNGDGSYSLAPVKLDIDEMLAEFKGYLGFVLGDDSKVTYEKIDGYYDTVNFLKDGSDKDIDYSKLVYATGTVDIGTDDTQEIFGNMFVKDSDIYKAMAAVNELQYAYTTDTGVLSQYIGYTVSAYETSYIKEFEYCTQEAIKNGAGSFAVCSGDYGWHLIYVTATYSHEGGAVYAPVWSVDRVNTEGTFENMFYEWIKGTVLSAASSNQRTLVLGSFGGDDTITKYEDVYKDLLGN